MSKNGKCQDLQLKTIVRWDHISCDTDPRRKTNVDQGRQEKVLAGNQVNDNGWNWWPLIFSKDLSAQLEGQQTWQPLWPVSCFLFIYLYWLPWNKYLPWFTHRVLVQQFCNQGWKGISKCRCVIWLTKISQRKTWDLKKTPEGKLLLFWEKLRGNIE